MKIAVDAGCLGVIDERLKVGVYTVVKNLLLQLAKTDKKNEYFLYSFYPIEKALLRKLSPKMKNIIIPSTGWLQLSLPTRLFFDKPDVFLATGQALPKSLPFSHYKTIGIFYDIAFEKYPEGYSYAASISKHRHNSRYLAQHADKLIAISQTTKKDVEKIYAIEPSKIIVAYPGINKELRIKNKELNNLKKSNPYFLFVGAFKKMKNIPFLLEAFATFSKLSKDTYDLILVGGDKWLDPKIETTLKEIPLDIQNRIHQLGFVKNNMLFSLYKGAAAFVCPSLYEGFGLSFIEAQSVGCPVIGSIRGSLPEIIGESGLLINPENERQLVKAMREITENVSLRKRLIQKGKENSKKYSWKSFARLVQSAIEKV